MGEENGRVRNADKPFQPRRFHIKKNQYTGLYDVKLTISVINEHKKVVEVEGMLCEHKDYGSAMLCAEGVDCLNGIPVGRLH